MRYLETYKKLKIPNNDEAVFNYFMSTLKESIFTWDYFVDFKKSKENIEKIEKELTLLNVLIGKPDIDKAFLSLIKEYPKVRKVLPILIAIRNNKIRETRIIDDFEKLISEDKSQLFNPDVQLSKDMEEHLLKFFKESGLKQVFQDKNIKSVVDYCLGVEVGMDTNARKNRTGTSMENIVEKILEKFCKQNNIEFLRQATKSRIKEKWGFDITLDKTDRRFDFAIFNKKKNKICLVETNFYGGGGSKLKSTAGEYQYLYDFLKRQNIDLVWVTDGKGWETTKKSLFETFTHNDYLFNIEMIKNDVLKEIIL